MDGVARDAVLTGDARIVHKYIEATEFFLHFLQEMFHGLWITDVRHGSCDPAVSLGHLLDGLFVDICNVDACSVRRESLRNSQTDAACSGSNEYSLGHDRSPSSIG
jgi:hypothetical protein